MSADCSPYRLLSFGEELTGSFPVGLIGACGSLVSPLGSWLCSLGACWGVWVGTCAAGCQGVVAVSGFGARRF